MLSECGCCQKQVEEVNGEFECECGTRWKMGAGRKKSLFKKRPSWLARNAKKIKLGLLISSALGPMVAATVLVMQASIIAG